MKEFPMETLLFFVLLLKLFHSIIYIIELRNLFLTIQKKIIAFSNVQKITSRDNRLISSQLLSDKNILFVT
jgi:hypothetical protein